MDAIIFTNSKGESIELGTSHPYIIEKINGVSGLNNQLNKEKSPYQDGATITNSSLSDRTITLQGALLGTTSEEITEIRRNLLKAFNPKLKGKLIYIYDGGEKEINCSIEYAPIITESNVWRIHRFLINLVAASPFWLDTFTTGEEIISWIGGISFPFSFPISFASKGENKKNIINDGDVETPLEITFRGPAANPKIINVLTGEFIKIKRSLTADDALVINTEFGNKKVEIIGKDGSKTNAFNYIDLNSTFFQLQVGDNILEYSSDNNIDPASVSIKYRNRYVGV